MTGVGGRDSGHSHCGEWRPEPSVLGAVEEWLALNATVRRAGEWQGALSFTSMGGLKRGGDELPA